jgi:hypothetical protein
MVSVSYQFESNQVNQIRHEDGDGHHLSSSQQPKIRYISPFRLPYIEYHRKRSDKLCIIPNCWPFDSFSIVSEQTLQARLHISKNESDIVWLAISDKLKWPHRYENWYKTILNSTQNKKFVRSLAMILYIRQAKRGNVPYLRLLAWGKMMSITVFMTNLIHLIWFQLIGYSIIDPAMKATQAK